MLRNLHQYSVVGTDLIQNLISLVTWMMIEDGAENSLTLQLKMRDEISQITRYLIDIYSKYNTYLFYQQVNRKPHEQC